MCRRTWPDLVDPPRGAPTTYFNPSKFPVHTVCPKSRFHFYFKIFKIFGIEWIRLFGQNCLFYCLSGVLVQERSTLFIFLWP